MEDADSGCAKGWIVLDEYKETEDGSGQLENQRHEENALDKTNQALPGVQIHGLPDEISTLHVYLFTHCQDDACADGGYPKAADLNESHEKELA